MCVQIYDSVAGRDVAEESELSVLADNVHNGGAVCVEDITYLENLNLKPISSVFLENPDIHKYLYELFPDAQILEERYVEYHCDCSRERFMRNLLTLPMKDLEEIAQEEDVEVKCEFCNKSYHFNQDDMKTIMSYANKR